MFGKIILGLIMLLVSAICILVLAKRRLWQQQLFLLESECDLARDQLVVQATMTRAQLAEVSDRLKGKNEISNIEAFGKLVNQAMPVLALLVHKETSLFKWGLAGLNLIRSAMNCFSGAEKQ